MRLIIGITSSVFAIASFVYGFITEFRQSRITNLPVATVPTLPFAVASSIFVGFALWGYDVGLPTWGYPLVFVGSVMLLGFLILKSSCPRNNSDDDTVNNTEHRGSVRRR
jgi:hypothetical protein